MWLPHPDLDHLLPGRVSLYLQPRPNQGILNRCERWRLYSVAEDSFGQPLKFVLFHVPNAKLMEVAAWVF